MFERGEFFLLFLAVEQGLSQLNERIVLNVVESEKLFVDVFIVVCVSLLEALVGYSRQLLVRVCHDHVDVANDLRVE